MDKIRSAIYARVSTNDQTTENQLLALRDLAERNGHQIVAEYIDHGVSGVAAKKDARAKLLLDAKTKKFSVLYCVSIDRLSRSTKDLLQVVEELNTLNITLIFQRENIDTKSAMGQFFLTVLSSIAQLERETMISRINAGIARAKSQGKKLGRPSKLNASLVNAVNLLRENGVSIRDISKTANIGVGTVYAILRGQELSKLPSAA
ncbi:MAG: recombinase family protein [Proteobacteria bacterium]|nr:recombinase family protein [Pseudomonadota bacterium]